MKRQGGTIHNWLIREYGKNSKVIFGEIQDDEEWEDGEIIRTSTIIKIKKGIVETRNTIYKLGDKAILN